MKLRFNVDYRTSFGEDLMLNMWLEEKSEKVRQHKMTTQDGEHWMVELTCPLEASSQIDYYYSVMRGDEEIRHEWLAEPHRVECAVKEQADRMVLYDHWMDIPEDAFLYSSAFTECLMARRREEKTRTDYPCTIRLKVHAPQLKSGQRLAVVGEPECLGAWDVEKALLMSEHECHVWVADLDATRLPGSSFEFKFVILTQPSPNRASVVWEQSANRSVTIPEINNHEVVVYELSQAFFPIYPWKGAGTVVPIFSLRSEGSFCRIPCLVVRDKHTESTILVFQVGTHDRTNDVVTFLHHRIQIGLLTVT